MNTTEVPAPSSRLLRHAKIVCTSTEVIVLNCNLYLIQMNHGSTVHAVSAIGQIFPLPYSQITFVNAQMKCLRKV